MSKRKCDISECENNAIGTCRDRKMRINGYYCSKKHFLLHHDNPLFNYKKWDNNLFIDETGTNHEFHFILRIKLLKCYENRHRISEVKKKQYLKK